MHIDACVPSLLDSVIMCNSVYMLCVCICVYVYVCVVFKNGKGSFTQCILVRMHKGICEPSIMSQQVVQLS